MNKLGKLIDMHTYCRPMGSATEKLFIDRYVASLPNAYQDPYKNWHVVIGDSPIIWSCHTDTVAHHDGRQTLHYDAVNSILALSRKSKSVVFEHTWKDKVYRSVGRNCLGADDTAGVFICSEMVLANVPGHYIFHYGEESGGIGSGDLKTYTPETLALYDYAIAFDRRGYRDIVTHQWGMRTASELFAYGLGEALEVAGLKGYTPHDGVYTDTAEYADIISECSNLSVGYQHEHSMNETLDCDHVFKLLAALIALDQDSLVKDREPGTDDYEWMTEPTCQYETVATQNPDVPIQHFCLMCDERINPLVEHDCPALLDNEAYLDRVYADVQKALTQVNNDPTDIQTWKLRHRRVS
jgi:hypothetical protein